MNNMYNNLVSILNKYKWLVGLATGLVVFILMTQTVMAQDIDISESDNQITITVDISDIGEGSGELVQDGDKVIWQYVGPENTADVTEKCDQIRWSSIQARSVELEADMIDEQMAEAKLDYDYNLTTDYGYCFKIDFKTDFEEGSFFKAYTLKTVNNPVDKETGFEFEATSPLEGTQIPSSIKLTTIDLAEVEADSWQYAVLDADSSANCQTDNLDFQALEETTTTSASIQLNEDFAGKTICFRAMNQGSAEDEATEPEYTYDSYKIATVAEESSGNWFWWALSIAVVVVAIIFIIRFESNSNKSKASKTKKS